MMMAANRFKGVRAGLGWSAEAARSIKNDEDANVLALPSEVLHGDEWKQVVDTWLTTPFAGAPRFKRRNRQLDELA
jgi:ribose 5-phosphate isomerase B